MNILGKDGWQLIALNLSVLVLSELFISQMSQVM